MESSATERQTRFLWLAPPTSTLSGTTPVWALGQNDMVNGFRPLLRGLLITHVTLCGNVTVASASTTLDLDIFKDSLASSIVNIGIDRSSTGWVTARSEFNAYCNPNDVSPQWLGARLKGTGAGGTVTNISFQVEGEYLWA